MKTLMRPRTLGYFVTIALLLQTTADAQESAGITVSKPKATGLKGDEPLRRVVGDHVLFTCVVRHDNIVINKGNNNDDNKNNNNGNYTVLWKRLVSNSSEEQLLTAGDATVIDDERIRVIHDKGGKVYVLEVGDVRVSDSGEYVCESSSAEKTRTFYSLVVSEKRLATNSSENFFPLWNASTSVDVDHDFTDCCVQAGVQHQCLGYCSLNRILHGQTVVKASQCESEFGLIVSCMADGKDHTNCCRRQGVPDQCQDLCRGEYNVVDVNDARTQVACNAFTPNTLFCVAEGIKVLPGRPSEPWVTHLTSTSFELSWNKAKDANSIEPNFYQISVQHIDRMVDEAEEEHERPRSISSPKPVRLIDVPARMTSQVVPDLEPFSVYNVSVKAVNEFGSSLPSYHMIVLTLRSEASKEWHGPKEEMRAKLAMDKLNDDQIDGSETCCIQRNVTHKRCVEGFCDQHRVSSVSVPDMMICAPWVGDMFGCLTDDLDKEDVSCCTDTPMPSACRDMCIGNITQTIDFNHFQCVSFMPSISRCLLQRRGLLASPPTQFRFSNVGVTTGLLHWDDPDKLADTVSEYHVHLRQMAPKTDAKERLFVAKRNDFVLENLDADASYEVYVGAVNGHGEGEASVRIVFRTASITADNLENLEENKGDNETVVNCCRSAGVATNCEPLCRHDLALSSMPHLSALCQHDSFRITKCLSGGRDHKPCCQRMGVSNRCDPICQGVQSHSALSLFSGECSAFIGNILTCMQDNRERLPPPIEHFRAEIVVNDQNEDNIGNTSDVEVNLYWDYEQSDFAARGVYFQVFYKKLEDQDDLANVFTGNEVVNSSTTSLQLTNLSSNNSYRLFGIARNKLGNSVPSSILVINTGLDSKTSKVKIVNGVPMAPHGVFVRARGYDYIEIVWSGPVVSHPKEHIRFKVSYKPLESSSSSQSRLTSPTHSVLTDATSVRLTHLKANTQYLINVRCQNSKGESVPSETLRVWTNPIVSVALEKPEISPKLVKSGSDVVITCFAIGSPVPEVGLYIGGHLVRKAKTRRLVTTITNVTKDLNEVSCHAWNGFGAAQMRSTRLRVQSAPLLKILFNSKDVSQQRIINVDEHDSIDLQCLIMQGEPRPKLVMGKRMDNKDNMPVFESIISDDKYVGKKLTFDKVSKDNEGIYFCQADNPHGQAYIELRLKVRGSMELRNRGHRGDSLSCCQSNGVPSECQGICALSIDIDFLLYKPECFQHFETLMTCGADGSDHRHCCQKSGVAPACLDWCRGEAVDNSSLCALSHARDIAKCFDTNRDKLPSPPRNVHVVAKDKDESNANDVEVAWDAPERNADQVDLYRVMWRPRGERNVSKMDTADTKLVLTNLRPDIDYELVVKAGNALGTSQLTQPIAFVVEDISENHKGVVLAKTEYSAWPSILITLVALVALAALVVAVYILWQRYGGVKAGGNKYSQFENEQHNGHTMAMNGMGKQEKRSEGQEMNLSHAVENPMYESNLASS